MGAGGSGGGEYSPLQQTGKQRSIMGTVRKSGEGVGCEEGDLRASTAATWPRRWYPGFRSAWIAAEPLPSHFS